MERRIDDKRAMLSELEQMDFGDIVYVSRVLSSNTIRRLARVSARCNIFMRDTRPVKSGAFNHRYY